MKNNKDLQSITLANFFGMKKLMCGITIKSWFPTSPYLPPSLYSLLSFLHSEFGPQTRLQIKALRPTPPQAYLSSSSKGLSILFPEKPHLKKS